MKKLEMYGVIGVDVRAAEVVAFLEDAGDEPVRIHLNSEGGAVDAATAVFNRIQAREGKTECVIDGLAASAATIIAMACDTIIMPHNAMMMVHNAWTPRGGNADELRSAADMLEKTSDAMAAIYAERTGLDMERVKALLAEEAWLSAEECLAMGFCDFVTGGSKQVEARAAYAMAQLRKHIEEEADAAPVRVAHTTERESADTEGVDMTPEEIEALQLRLAEMEKENAELRNALDANREEVDEQAAKVVALEDSITKKELEASNVPVEQVEAVAALKRHDLELYNATVQMFASAARVDEQPRIGVPGDAPTEPGALTVDTVLAMANEAGVSYGNGLAKWLAKNHPEFITEALAASK